MICSWTILVLQIRSTQVMILREKYNLLAINTSNKTNFKQLMKQLHKAKKLSIKFYKQIV